MKMTSSFSRSAINLQSKVALTDDVLKAYAPSIFKEQAHDSRSARFQCIPTFEIVQAMRNEGFQPFSVVQGGSRIEGKADFTKHMLRFRHESTLANNEAQHEIVLINAHDGTSAYKLFSGMIRFVCQNGLITGDNIETFRVGHTGKVLDKVIEGSYRILDNVKAVEHNVEEMQDTILALPEIEAFGRAALILKYDNLEEAHISPLQATAIRRHEDAAPTLWNVFNRTQENLIKGGTAYVQENNRMNRTRAVKNIDENTKLNRALWTLADAMQNIKSKSEDIEEVFV